MFYDIDLMVNSCLSKPWRAGNGQSLKSNCENITLPTIAEELDKWVASDILNPRRRLSLRASSILVNGLCRLYRDETDKLLKDAFKLSQQIMLRNNQCDVSSSEDDDESSSTDSEYEEDMIPVNALEYKTEDTSTIFQRKGPIETENSLKGTKRTKLSALSNSLKSNSDNQGSDHNLGGLITGSINLFEECNIPSKSNLEEQEQEEGTRKDKAVQTFNSSLRNTGHCSGACTGFDQNLPFGVTLIHDTYHSRIPSKILLCSLCAAVKNKLKIN